MRDDARGLSNALVEGADPGSLLRSPVEDPPNLLVMTSGPQPPNSAALLRGAEMGHVLEQLAADADLVVVDAPPLLPVADTRALLDQPQLDAYLLVGREDFTKRDEARYTKQLLDSRELRGVGLVINCARQLAGGRHYQYEAADRSVGVGRARQGSAQ
jgi:Mrp family chromosome partitioning ATPase